MPRRLAFELAGAVPEKLLVSAARLLGDQVAAVLVDVIDAGHGLAWERELALAGALGDRGEPRVREWAARLVRASQARPAAPPPVVRARRPLNLAEREHIAICPDSELDAALEPALSGPVAGLAVALERRDPAPSVAACVALLGCVDPLDDVVRELDRFAAATPDFDGQLDAAAAARWPEAGVLPLLAHARLHRWEAHRRAVLRWIEESGGVLGALAVVEALPGRVAARSLWRAIGEALAFLRYRDRAGFDREASQQLAELAADHIDRDIGPDAARILVLLVEAGSVPLSAVRDRILDRAADSMAGVREQLARLIRIEGLPEPPPMPATPATEAQLVAAIRQSRDLDELVGWCEHARRQVVEAAVLRLLVLGAPGQDRLAGLLPRMAELPAPAPLLASIPLWGEPGPRATPRASWPHASWSPPICRRSCASACTWAWSRWATPTRSPARWPRPGPRTRAPGSGAPTGRRCCAGPSRWSAPWRWPTRLIIMLTSRPSPSCSPRPSHRPRSAPRCAASSRWTGSGRSSCAARSRCAWPRCAPTWPGRRCSSRSLPTSPTRRWPGRCLACRRRCGRWPRRR